MCNISPCSKIRMICLHCLDGRHTRTSNTVKSAEENNTYCNFRTNISLSVSAWVPFHSCSVHQQWMKLTHFQFIPVARQHKVVHKTGPFASVGARPSVTDCACVKERGTTCVTDLAELRRRFVFQAVSWRSVNWPLQPWKNLEVRMHVASSPSCKRMQLRQVGLGLFYPGEVMHRTCYWVPAS